MNEQTKEDGAYIVVFRLLAVAAAALFWFGAYEVFKLVMLLTKGL